MHKIAVMPVPVPFPRFDLLFIKIKDLIEPEAWKRCDAINRAEQESLKNIISKWNAA